MNVLSKFLYSYICFCIYDSKDLYENNKKLSKNDNEFIEKIKKLENIQKELKFKDDHF
jgi:hypothetical protein